MCEFAQLHVVTVEAALAAKSLELAWTGQLVSIRQRFCISHLRMSPVQSSETRVQMAKLKLSLRLAQI
jgi:hypothetical protein